MIYFNHVLVDCGVTFSTIKPYLKDIALILISHEHGDHLNISTLKKIQFERPSIRIGCGEFLKEKLTGLRNVDILAAGKIYDYGKFKVSPIMLYHDVENFGFRIFKDNTKIIHATDTTHLQGITAKNYAIYALEANYDEDTVWDTIFKKEGNGEYAHQRGAINSHLSLQQAQNFVLKNAGDSYEFVRLHESSEF